jgi:hypothetical protein
MTDTPRLTPARRAEHAAREARRAKALRENLRRRKEQARARSASDAESPAPAPQNDEAPA